jgi:hypothetical protein
MRKLIIIITAIYLISSVPFYSYNDSKPEQIKYEIDLTKSKEDLFYVTCYPGQLSIENQYLNFVAFAPGVHQALDYGRFVKSLIAYNKNGEIISTEKISTNRWIISNPKDVYKNIRFIL